MQYATKASGPRLLRRAGHLLLRPPPHRGRVGGPHRLRRYRWLHRRRSGEAIRRQAEQVGAVEHHEIDARERGLRPLRPLPDPGQRAPGRGLSPERGRRADPAGALGGRGARRIGARAVAHGSTGAGNDQVRFDVALRVLAPDLQIITPIRDEAIQREQAIAFLELLAAFRSPPRPAPTPSTADSGAPPGAAAGPTTPGPARPMSCSSRRPTHPRPREIVLALGARAAGRAGRRSR